MVYVKSYLLLMRIYLFVLDSCRNGAGDDPDDGSGFGQGRHPQAAHHGRDGHRSDGLLLQRHLVHFPFQSARLSLQFSFEVRCCVVPFLSIVHVSTLHREITGFINVNRSLVDVLVPYSSIRVEDDLLRRWPPRSLGRRPFRLGNGLLRIGIAFLNVDRLLRFLRRSRLALRGAGLRCPVNSDVDDGRFVDSRRSIACSYSLVQSTLNERYTTHFENRRS